MVHPRFKGRVIKHWQRTGNKLLTGTGEKDMFPVNKELRPHW